MLASVSQSNLMIFRGIKLSMINTIDDDFHQMLIQDTEPNETIINENYLGFDKLPKKFVNIDTWIISTNLHCRYCTLTFDEMPVIIPETIKIDNKGRKIYPVFERICFCDFPCAVGYVKQSNLSNKTEKLSMLNDLYFQFYGKKPIAIKEPQFSPSCLEMYGGDKTINEYKEIIKNANKSIIFSVI